jgi:hypothetical protein
MDMNRRPADSSTETTNTILTKRPKSAWTLAGFAITKLEKIDVDETEELKGFPGSIKAKHEQRRQRVIAELSPEAREIVEANRKPKRPEARAAE